MAGDAITPIPTEGGTDSHLAARDGSPDAPGDGSAIELGTADAVDLHASPTMTSAGMDDVAREPGEATKFPDKIGHYKVVREIGAGGMGHVLKCLDTTLNRYVALKILRAGLARNATFIERFKREAHAVAQLRHPNIVQIYSIGEEDNYQFFTMEYVDGEGLDRLLSRRTRLPEREALKTMHEVCMGLQEAHDSEILHRDIKPGNVLINNDGRAQLSDFGLAKFVYQQTLRVSEDAHAAGVGRNDGSMTDPGRVMGTPFYMAPELIQGREADPRTEVYALGAMMYELLAGQVPFKKDTVDLIFDAHLGELPPPIAALNPEVSLDTAKIVYRALEKSPSARYQSAGELAEALQAGLERERRAAELQARAQLGAEMATAFGSARIGAAGASRLGPIITRLLLLLLVIGGLWAVVEAMQMPDAKPAIPGSAISDTAYASGTECRVAGIVSAVEENAAFVRFSLDNPDGTRWLRIQRGRWDAMGATVPSTDTWWAAEGRVARATDGVNELEIAPGKLWPAGPLDRHKLVEDSSHLSGIKLGRVADWSGEHLGRRVALVGTVVWRKAEGNSGPVRLLVARGDQSVRVKVPRPVAKQNRRFGDIRAGEQILVVGRLAEIEEGEDTLLEPRDELTVEAGNEIQRESRTR